MAPVSGQLCEEHHKMFSDFKEALQKNYNETHDTIKDLAFKIVLFGNKLDTTTERVNEMSIGVDNVNKVFMGDATTKGLITEVKEHTKVIEKYENIGVGEMASFVKDKKTSLNTVMNWIYKAIVLTGMAYLCGIWKIPFHG